MMIHPCIPLVLAPETKCILVGNGPSLLKQAKGREIDTFDEVVRFNRFRIHGFESFTGMRTTLWSTFGHGYLPGDEQVRPERIIFVQGERGEPAYQGKEIHRIPDFFYNECKQRVLKRTTGNPNKIGMTSGYLVALWMLEVVGLKQIVLSGFDHFRKDFSKQHHYYNPKFFSKPSGHDGKVEALILAETQRVIYL